MVQNARLHATAIHIPMGPGVVPDWAAGKDLRSLLLALHEMLPAMRWRPVAQLQSTSALANHYQKAIMACHPDRCAEADPAEKKHIAEVLAALQGCWADFEHTLDAISICPTPQYAEAAVSIHSMIVRWQAASLARCVHGWHTNSLRSYGPQRVQQALLHTTQKTLDFLFQDQAMSKQHHRAVADNNNVQQPWIERAENLPLRQPRHIEAQDLLARITTELNQNAAGAYSVPKVGPPSVDQNRPGTLLLAAGVIKDMPPTALTEDHENMQLSPAAEEVDLALFDDEGDRDGDDQSLDDLL